MRLWLPVGRGHSLKTSTQPDDFDSELGSCDFIYLFIYLKQKAPSVLLPLVTSLRTWPGVASNFWFWK